MTVANQVKEALGTLISAQASLEQFTQKAQNEKTKQIYSNAAAEIKDIIVHLDNRLTTIEQEEPQYRNLEH
ncbi:DUF1657 domain-containing protein [Virgibacillus oceani]|uniref:DUF1657 domain-containing protein n=1 Tax=Virgibacillus oceani TaxID=1479511 RepID=A0A917HSK0_9BACI|nr:DUF1657 domain-containing protein [Virgibacillus oceani]GGG88036.1 hypothetical protein GCM10011398_37520 [Virgibacillus oceani]